ncbi:MAG: hypothetical protein O3A29_20175 [Planctomycetota bacterium]|nr:hypothetical protein [Planctomycetota bacterium]
MLISSAVVLLVVAWGIAQYPPISRFPASTNVSISKNLLIAGAFPWFLQWGAIVCAMVAAFGWQTHKRAGEIAMAVSLTFAIIWWGGLALWFRGMEPLNTIVEAVSMQINSAFGNLSLMDHILFHGVGPLVGPLQLRGPSDLGGWNFLSVLGSTTLLVGYLFFVGRRFGHLEFTSTSPRDYVRMTLACLPFTFVPIVAGLVRGMR